MPIVSPWLHRPTSVSDLFGWGNEHEAKGAKGVKGEDAYENEGTQKKPLIAKEPPLPHGDVEVVEEEGVEDLGENINLVADKSPSLSFDIIIALLSNVTTSFNVVSISLVLKVMDSSDLWGSEETDEATAACSSALIAGMVCGQLLFGSLGDIIGLDFAMVLTILTQIIGCLGSAMSFEIEGSNISIFAILAIWRFILGVGCGGVYPLAANMASSSAKKEKDRGQSVALVFSMQGVGYLIPPVLCLLLVAVLGDGNGLVWRLMLGFGVIPGIILVVLRRKYRLITNRGKVMRNVRKVVDKSEIWIAIKEEEDLFKKLVGTAGCWFLFDILFYGNTLFQPVVLSAAFGDSEDVATTAGDTAILGLLGLPGYFVSVFLIGKQGPRFIQGQGFLIMSVLYFVIGLGWNDIKNTKALLLFLYGGTFFFANYGPNSTTFVLPSMTFSPKCRSTLNGISAASGKLGAFLGATMFEPVAQSIGNDSVMVICGVISLAGFFITLWAIESDVGRGRRKDDDREVGEIVSFVEEAGTVE